ncbi:GDP-mannose 4,6-dehydratase [Cytobacillus oceanisediminis]
MPETAPVPPPGTGTESATAGSRPQGRVALVTGVAGQDGMYVSRLLLSRGWTVVGTIRPGTRSVERMRPYLDGVTLVEHDQRDVEGFERLLEAHRPDSVYNLAGFSAVQASWQAATEVLLTNSVAVVDMLEAIVRLGERTGSMPRFLQASSAEMYGPATTGPLTEAVAHDPRTPYAVSKSAAHYAVNAYRDRHEVFGCGMIMFNHESPFRGRQFIAGKVARLAAEVSRGMPSRMTLGALDVERDWLSAADVAAGLVAALDHDAPGDYILATGHGHTLRDMLTVAFAAVGRDDALDHVDLEPTLWSAIQAARLVGDPSHARETLGWRPTVDFEQLVTGMVEVELERLASGVEESAHYLRPDGAR